MGRIKDTAASVNLWSALGERGLKIANFLGWEISPSKIINAAWPALLLVGGMIWQHVAWYWVVPCAVFMVGALLHLYAGIARAMAVQGVRKLSLQDAAAACERAEKAFYDFVEARSDEVAAFEEAKGRRSENVADYDAARMKEDEFMAKMRARIGGDVGAAVAMLKVLGIEAESDLRSLHWADRMTRIFGTQARLLRDGHLEAAQKLNRRDLFN